MQRVLPSLNSTHFHTSAMQRPARCGWLFLGVCHEQAFNAAFDIAKQTTTDQLAGPLGRVGWLGVFLASLSYAAKGRRQVVCVDLDFTCFVLYDFLRVAARVQSHVKHASLGAAASGCDALLRTSVRCVKPLSS